MFTYLLRGAMLGGRRVGGVCWGFITLSSLQVIYRFHLIYSDDTEVLPSKGSPTT